MEEEIITRSYLERLSFSDLKKLADEYGVDVPEDLDRRFLLSELLEIAEETRQDKTAGMIISFENSINQSTSLPQGYNETHISCVLRNPVWAFVFWDISDTDMNMLASLPSYSLSLRVCILVSETEMVPQESFEIEIPNGVNEQYVLIPSGNNFIRIELVYTSGANREVLAFSPVISMPKGSSNVEKYQPGLKNDFPEILKLSGIEKLLSDQYKNYRHSFS